MKLVRKKLHKIVSSILSQRTFFNDAMKMKSFASNIDLPNKGVHVVESEIFWVLVTPWIRTAVPWYALTLALMMRLQGVSIIILWDDLIVDDISLEEAGVSNRQNRVIGQILGQVKNYFNIVKLSEIKSVQLHEKDEQELMRLAKMNTIHKYRSSVSTEMTSNYTSQWVLHQKFNMQKIKGLFCQHKIHRILLPGGVYGNSGLYNHFIEKKENVSSFDCGFNRALICVNGITGYQEDVTTCLESPEIKNMKPEYRNIVRKMALQELELRKNGNDFYSTQVLPLEKSTKKYEHDIIIPLNITWDLPALGKHRLFESDYDWVVETVTFILNHTNASVAVRQHPHERHHSSGVDFSNEMKIKYDYSDRFRMYSCDDEMNTYSLMLNAKLVLPYVSTIGIEAALMRKTVIMESDGYYSNYSFVQKAYSKTDYFDLIKENLSFPKELTIKQYEDALICYYLTQKCTAEDTYFTPHNINFREWILKGHDELLTNDSVRNIVRALVTKTPLALINHRKIIKANANIVDI
jgi:hypothetical protein